MTEPLARLPHRLDATALVGVLASIGLPLPDGARSLSAEDKPLAAAGVAFTVDQVDEALDKTKLPTAERLTLKVALVQQGLLPARRNAVA